MQFKPIKPHSEFHRHRLPRAVTITASLTADEFSRLAEQASQAGLSLSEYGRENLLASIPFEDWLDSATHALANKEEDIAKKEKIRLARRRINRRKNQGISQFGNNLSALRKQTTEEKIQQDKELVASVARKPRRVAKLQIRLTAYEDVRISWQAYCLKMSKSSFIRKMVLGYLPGGEDDNTIPWKTYSQTGSRIGREEMLQAVIKVCADGRIPPCSSLFYCKTCAGELAPGDKS